MLLSLSFFFFAFCMSRRWRFLFIFLVEKDPREILQILEHLAIRAQPPTDWIRPDADEDLQMEKLGFDWLNTTFIPRLHFLQRVLHPPTASICGATVLKKKLPDFFSCRLSSLQLSAVMSDQWRSLSMLPCWSYQLHLPKLEAWLLLQLNETSHSCFSTSFFPSFLSRFLWLSFHLLLKLSCAQNEWGTS